MKRMLLLPLALVAALVVAASGGAAAKATRTVQVTAGGFTPAAITVSVGDSVTWHNADNANHQVVANNGTFASPVLKPGDTYTQTFNASGKTNYHDALATKHTASVTVTEAVFAGERCRYLLRAADGTSIVLKEPSSAAIRRRQVGEQAEIAWSVADTILV